MGIRDRVRGGEKGNAGKGRRVKGGEGLRLGKGEGLRMGKMERVKGWRRVVGEKKGRDTRKG